jgi:ketosteroid isomerase-like protein
MTEVATGPSDPTGFADFLSRCHDALAQQGQGQPEPFLALWSHADDVTIMAAIGGYHTGFDQVSVILTQAAKSQNFETFDAENLATILGEQLACTVEVERRTRQVDGNEDQLTVRATMVYRLEGAGWRVVHRHGDLLTPVEVRW